MTQDMRFRLADEDVLEIKKAYWEGATQDQLAFTYNVSQATIYRIVKGKQRADVPWPDGSRGPLSQARQLEIISRRLDQAPGRRIPSQQDLAERERVLNSIKEREAQSEKSHSDWQDQVDQMGQAAEAELEEGLKEAVKVKGKPDKSKIERVKEVKYEKADWDDILKRAPKNPLVVYAQEDEIFREAVCIVFKSFNEVEWNTSWAARLSKQISGEVFDHVVEVEFKMKDGTG